MAEFSIQEGLDWLRSGAYSKPIIAITIKPIDMFSQFSGASQLLLETGGVIRVATEYINTGESIYWGTLKQPIGLRKKLKSTYIGGPVKSNAVLSFRIIDDSIPEWWEDLKNCDFNGAEIHIQFGWRGLPPYNQYAPAPDGSMKHMRQLDIGVAHNGRATDDGRSIEIIFNRTEKLLDMVTGCLTESDTTGVPLPDTNSGGRQFPVGQVARMITEPPWNYTQDNLSSPLSYDKRGNWQKTVGYAVNDVIHSRTSGDKYWRCTSGGTSAGTDDNLPSSDTGCNWTPFTEEWRWYVLREKTPLNAILNGPNVTCYLNGVESSLTLAAFEIRHYPIRPEIGISEVKDKLPHVHAQPSIKLEIDCTNPPEWLPSSNRSPTGLFDTAIAHADAAFMPFPAFHNGSASNFVNAYIFDQNSQSNNGYTFSEHDANKNENYDTWADALDRIIGGNAGSWITNRMGQIVLINVFKQYFRDSLPYGGTITKNDFTKHTRKTVNQFSTVELKGKEWLKEGNPRYSALAGQPLHGGDSALPVLSIESSNVNFLAAATLANDIKSSKLILHTFHGCRIGMLYDVGDKITFNEQVDDIPRGAYAVVVTAPVSINEPFEVVLE